MDVPDHVHHKCTLSGVEVFEVYHPFAKLNKPIVVQVYYDKVLTDVKLEPHGSFIRIFVNEGEDSSKYEVVVHLEKDGCNQHPSCLNQ